MRSYRNELALAVFAIVCASTSVRASAQACHEGRVDGDGIRWRTTILVPSARIAPLSSDVALESVEGGTARYEGGRLVGIDASGGGEPVVLVTSQSIHGNAITLHPALVDAPQRIVLTSRDGERIGFVPALDGPIERHVGFNSARDIDGQTRAQLDAWCGPHERAVPTFVRDVREGDLRGDLVRASEQRGSLLWIGWLVLAFGVIGGLLGYRRLSARAQLERADAVIEGRFRHLERTEPPRR